MSFVAASYSAMNRDSTLKIARTRSPTSSMIAAKSSCFASAFPMSLMTASSALRWSVSVSSRFVSSNRRALSSATAMLDASVLEEPLVGLVVGVGLDVLQADHPEDAVAAEDRDAEPGVGHRAAGDRAQGVRFLPAPDAERRPCPDDDRGQPGPEGERFGLEALALIDLVRERDQLGSSSSYVAMNIDWASNIWRRRSPDELDDRLRTRAGSRARGRSR